MAGIIGREITKYTVIRRAGQNLYLHGVCPVFLAEKSPNIRSYVGLARTIYTWCMPGIFGREITKYTVYNYTVMADPMTQTAHSYIIYYATSYLTRTLPYRVFQMTVRHILGSYARAASG